MPSNKPFKSQIHILKQLKTKNERETEREKIRERERDQDLFGF